MGASPLVSGLRAVGVSFGGSAALAAAGTAAAIDLGRALASGRRPRTATLAAAGALSAYALVLRPRMRTWGASAEETGRRLPGDELVHDPGVEITQAVTIAAPPDQVWPWLAQLGQDRGGFYSYEWLENLAGCEMRNADRVHPEWQHREVGEEVPLHPLNGLRVTIFEPGRVIGLEGWGTFSVEAAGPGRSRLIARGRIPRGAPSLVYAALVEIPHFIMQRKMLLGIKQRAEAAAAVPTAA